MNCAFILSKHFLIVKLPRGMFLKNRQSFFVYESSPPSAGCSCFASSWLPSFRWGRTVKVGAVCKTAPLALDCPSNPAALTVCAQRNTIPTSEDAMGTTPVRSSKRVSDHHVSTPVAQRAAARYGDCRFSLCRSATAGRTYPANRAVDS